MSEKGYKIKLNTVITSFNFDDIEALIYYAARMRINIKLLDLFTVGGQFAEFQRVSIAEIKNRLMTLYRIGDEDFYQENDYLCADIMGIKVFLPQRVYIVKIVSITALCIHVQKVYSEYEFMKIIPALVVLEETYIKAL